MPDDAPSPEDRHEAVARKYAELKRAVEEAGFFAPHIRVEPEWNWECIVFTSKHRKEYGSRHPQPARRAETMRARHGPDHEG
jgi:hypothetical protein